MQNFVAIDQTWLRYGDFSIFFFKTAAGGCPPSWICYLQLQAWTIHEEYSVVFITAQSLVGIGAIVSIRYASADI